MHFDSFLNNFNQVESIAQILRLRTQKTETEYKIEDEDDKNHRRDE